MKVIKYDTTKILYIINDSHFELISIYSLYLNLFLDQINF